MLERQEAINLLTTKYRARRFDKAHAIIFTFPNGKQIATENTKAENQRKTFSLVVDSLPPKDVLLLDPVKFYPRGVKDRRANHNITQDDAPTLYWQDYDTWRIYPETRLEFEAFLRWYFDTNEDADSTRSSSDIAPPIPNDEQRDSPITANAQATLGSDTPNLKTDEREAVVKVRFGQGSFREALFRHYKDYGEKCWMSGIEGKRLLVASHIKPWSHCGNDTDSRGQPDNGLLLSALWDAAFDVGLVSFDPDWKVVVSSELSESAGCALNLNAHSALPEAFRTDGRKKYLTYHRAEVFEYWKKTESEKKVLP